MEQEINNALETLLAGGTILYPTDTIWGIGCDATNANAVETINMIKERPQEKGYIVLANNKEMISEYVPEIKQWENILEEHQNATIIYPQSFGFPLGVANPAGTVAIRIPNDSFCLELIKHLGNPIVSTSANKSGEAYPASYSDISASILEEVDYTVNLKQEEKTNFTPSAIIRITPEGKTETIRE